MTAPMPLPDWLCRALPAAKSRAQAHNHNNQCCQTSSVVCTHVSARIGEFRFRSTRLFALFSSIPSELAHTAGSALASKVNTDAQSPCVTLLNHVTVRRGANIRNRYFFRGRRSDTAHRLQPVQHLAHERQKRREAQIEARPGPGGGEWVAVGG